MSRLARRAHPLTLAAALALLVAFALALAGQRAESLWNDEAWSAWAVHSPYLADTLARVRADVHPPLYFLLLDGWTLVFGEAPLLLRLPSAFSALLALAGVYAVGRALFSRRAGLIALLLLGSSGFVLYYAREARMYSLLLALAALVTLAYVRWRRRPTPGRALLYAALLAALLYTHYVGALLILTHLLHLALRRAGGPRGWRLALPFGLALLLFAPWLPAALDQARANPGGPLALPVPTDWGTAAALALWLTGGQGGWVLLAFALGRALPAARGYRDALALLLLWLALTPAVLLALNAWVAPVYQARYAIAAAPAWALLAAYALHLFDAAAVSRLTAARRGLPPWVYRFVPPLALAALLSLIIAGQIGGSAAIWPGKPDWEGTLRRFMAARDSLTPAITDFAPSSPAGYYDRLLRVRQGIALDLSWRQHTPAELAAILTRLARAPSVWVALPVNTAKAWHISALLDQARGISARDGLGNLIFYRFDAGIPGDLAFRFGDVFRYGGALTAADRLAVAAGETLCVDVRLLALAAPENRFSAGLHLVDSSGQRSLAAWDGGLGAPEAGAAVEIAPCVAVPLAVEPGAYHLELSVYDWSNGARLPLLEASAAPISWGDVLVLAAVDVAAASR